MIPLTPLLGDSIFVLRRTVEEMPWPALFFPIAFAFCVVLFILMYRRGGQLWMLGIGSAVVLLAGGLYFALGFALREWLSWWLVLVPTLFVAFVYICLLDFRDARTVHFTSATFLR